MPSQEDYLDGLLRGLSKELEELEVEQKGLSAAESESESGIEEEIDLSALMPEAETSKEAMIPEEPDLLLSQEESDLLETLGGLEEAADSEISEEPVIPEESDLLFSQEESNLLETLGGLGEAAGPEISEEPVIPEESDLSFSQEESDLLETLGGLGEAAGPEISEAPDLSFTQEESDLLEALGRLEEAASPEILEAPDLLFTQEESDLLETLGGLEEAAISEDAAVSEDSGDADFVDISELSTMSEEEIEKLLAEGREMSEDNNKGISGDLGGDIVDILAGNDDSELKEIQDLLKKSDNNEAVGDEIKSLLQGVDQEENLIPADLLDSDETGEQQSPKQQKALEKKRLKEEAAAAKKAKKEARKAAKKAKKAGKQGEETAAANALEGVPAGLEGAIDTSLLDSILSEAGKISGDETATGLTGKNNAKVAGDLQDQLGETDFLGLGSGEDDSVSIENAEDLGLDLDSLFGNSDGAEDSVAVDGGESEFPDFVELDADDVAGIAELTGEDGEEDKPKKKGFFSRFIDFLMQEDEDEEEEKSENEDIRLSEENQEILKELDKEKNKKDKKGKKGKKKAKKADASAEEGEEGEETGDNKGKKKKEKKPKKEKPPKEVELVDPRKQLTLKKMMPILLFCLSLGLAIIILTNFSVDFADKKTAREAYYNGDYQTCYQNLFGKELNESDQVMFGKSESILIIRLWIREYEMFAEEGASLEALDCLIQAVNNYPDLRESASQWNAAGDVAVEYAVILNLLYENYGLTEDQVRVIAAEPDDIEYTKQVNAIVQGGVYGSWNQPETVVDVPLSDVLPEESELPDGNFIDTNTSAR